MKRFLVIPIMFIYLLAASGIMITLHYCGSKVESWAMYAEGDGCAGGKCGDKSEENDNCCKDKVITAKISNDQDIASVFKLKIHSDFSAIEQQVFYNEDTAVIVSETAPAYQPNAPPGLWENIPLYKLHSGFIYYG